MFFLKLSWYQQCLVTHFNLTISSNNNFRQFFGLGTVCLCCNVCYCDKQQEKEYIVFIRCISYFSIDFKNKMSSIIMSKDGVCRNIVFGSPIHLNSSENLTSYNSIKG